MTSKKFLDILDNVSSSSSSSRQNFHSSSAASHRILTVRASQLLPTLAHVFKSTPLECAKSPVKMTSNFYAFSFERPSASRNGSLAAQLPTVPSSRSGMVGQAASSIDTFVTVNSSLPQLSRRADSGTVAAAAAAGAGNPAARNAAAANVAAAGPLPQPRVNVTAAQAARDRRRLIHTKRSITSRFRAWHRGLAYWGLWNEAQQFYFMQFIGIPPRAGPFPGFNRPNRAQFPVLQRMAGRRQPLRGFMRRVVNRLRRRNQNRAPQDPKERLAEMLEEPLAAIVEPAGCRFRKRLGVGGQGAVFLIDLVGQDGRKIPIVAKACVGRNIGQDDALRQEKEAMMVSLLLIKTVILFAKLTQRSSVFDWCTPRRPKGCVAGTFLSDAQEDGQRQIRRCASSLWQRQPRSTNRPSIAAQAGSKSICRGALDSSGEHATGAS